MSKLRALTGRMMQAAAEVTARIAKAQRRHSGLSGGAVLAGSGMPAVLSTIAIIE